MNSPPSKRYYVYELGRYILLTLSFIMGFIVWGDATNWTEPIPYGVEDHTSKTEVIGGTIARALCWLLTLYNLVVEEGREFRAAKTARK